MKKQLSSEQALTKYEMYRKLRTVRKQADCKIGQLEGEEMGVNAEEIKQKINAVVKKKQQLIRGVNAAKSRQAHQNNWNSLIQKYNSSNFTSIVDEYIKNPLDDQKIEVLLQNFNQLAQRQPAMPISNVHAAEMGLLDAELQQIQKQVVSKSGFRSIPQLKNHEESLLLKKSQLQKVRQQCSYLQKEPNFILDEGLTNLREIQQQKQRLNQHIKEYQNEIENLNQEKNRKIKENMLRLQKQLQMEEEALIKARSGQANAPYGSKVSNAGKVTKKTCCCNVM